MDSRRPRKNLRGIARLGLHPSGTSWKNFTIGGPSKKQILLFTKNLTILLKSGSTLPESLLVLKDEAKGALRVILEDVYIQVDQGRKLSEALRSYPKVFPETYTNILGVGEDSGKLYQNLEYVTLQLEKSQTLKKKIQGAMIYPFIILIGGVGLGMAITIFVFPKVTTLFKNFKVELPFSTRILIAISDFFQQYGIFAVLGVSAGVFFIIWFFRAKSVQFITHWIALHLPVVKSISMHLNLALFCRTLSTLLQSGLTIDEGLQISARSVTNFYYKRFLTNAYDRIKAGDNLAAILHQDPTLFPNADVQIINVGETSGTLYKSLDYCSSIHEDEVDNLTKNLSTLLEPFLLLSMGLMVAFLALSIITPIYSITDQF